MKKKNLKRGERSDTYLTHFCRLPQSVVCVENKIDKTTMLAEISGFYLFFFYSLYSLYVTVECHNGEETYITSIVIL